MFLSSNLVAQTSLARRLLKTMQAFALPWRPTKAWPRSTVAVAIATISMLGVVFAAELQNAMTARLSSLLETRFERWPESLDRPIGGIIVLGGNIDRVTTALQLARAHPEASVILSGPAADEQELLLSATDIIRRRVIDTRPENTYENALYSAPIARGISNGPWLLVTDGFHMPRAIGVFREAGLDPLPWPISKSSHHEASGEQVRHELLGLAYYRLLGRTASLLPTRRD